MIKKCASELPVHEIRVVRPLVADDDEDDITLKNAKLFPDDGGDVM